MNDQTPNESSKLAVLVIALSFFSWMMIGISWTWLHFSVPEMSKLEYTVHAALLSICTLGLAFASCLVLKKVKDEVKRNAQGSTQEAS